jgi:hypothetical protein
LYEPGELRTAATDRLLIGFDKILPDRRIRQCLADLAIETGTQVLTCPKCRSLENSAVTWVYPFEMVASQ